MNYILEAFTTLALLGYFIWTAFTVYFVMISKRANQGTTIVGNIIWYHGVTWVCMMPFVASLTLALILAEYLSTILKIKLSIG